ncbi:hypothetical protein [Hugenholtzia roseola]|uniref:hypothetical protein n=1 Tax=Hugenholtzia roseola TaxID=1002 RepID=UPI00041AAEBF|nr:hypothetical protein [Hugenholtzia roseola]
MSDLKNLPYAEHRKILELQRQIHEQEIRISLLTLQKEGSQTLKSAAIFGTTLVIGFKVVGFILKKSTKKKEENPTYLKKDNLDNATVATKNSNPTLNFFKKEARKVAQTFLKTLAKELLVGFLIKK